MRFFVKRDGIGLPIFVRSMRIFIHNLMRLFLPIYLVGNGFNGWQIGLLLGLSSLAGFISCLPAGIGNDRVASKKIILYALVLSIVYYVGLLTLPSFLFLIVFFMIGGFGENLFNVSSDSLVYRIINKERSSSALGKYVAFINLAGVLGLIVGGDFINTYGFKNIILFILILLGMLAIISFMLPMTETFKFKFTEYKKDIFRKEVLVFLAVVFLFTFHYGAEATSYSLFLKERFALDLKGIGLFIGLCAAWISVAALFFSWRIEKGLHARYVFYFGLLVSGLGHILFSIQTELIPAIIFRCIHEIGDGAMIFSIHYGIVKIFNLNRIGGNTGLIALMQITGGFISATIFGYIGAKYGYWIPLNASGVMMLFALVLLFFSQETKKKLISEDV